MQNSTLSVQNSQNPGSPSSRVDMHKLTNDVATARNRLQALRNQLQRQKESIKKNKQLTQEVIAKKVAVNQINHLKNKDNSWDQERIQIQRKKNHSMRIQHQRSLENIYKAIYLVKLDDARQVKNISQSHKRKMRELQQSQMEQKIEQKKQQKFQSQLSKQRYMQYWQQKLSAIYAAQAENLQEQLKTKDEKQKELKSLEEQQLKLLEEINQVHDKAIESRKEYVAALSLSAKDVVEAIGNNAQGNAHKLENSGYRSLSLGQIQKSDKHKLIPLSPEREIKDKQKDGQGSIGNFGKSKVPNTSVNQAKLKIILQQLKKIDKKKQRYEQQYQDFKNENGNQSLTQQLKIKN